MGFLDRISLLAKGKFKTWRRGRDSAAPGAAELERELARSRPKPPTSSESAPAPADEPADPPDDYQRGTPDPENPRKRTL